MYFSFMYVCMYTMGRVGLVPRGCKQALAPVELELYRFQIIQNQVYGCESPWGFTGDQTQVLFKSSKCSELLSSLSSQEIHVLNVC